MLICVEAPTKCELPLLSIHRTYFLCNWIISDHVVKYFIERLQNVINSLINHSQEKGLQYKACAISIWKLLDLQIKIGAPNKYFHQHYHGAKNRSTQSHKTYEFCSTLCTFPWIGNSPKKRPASCLNLYLYINSIKHHFNFTSFNLSSLLPRDLCLWLWQSSQNVVCHWVSKHLWSPLRSQPKVVSKINNYKWCWKPCDRLNWLCMYWSIQTTVVKS